MSGAWELFGQDAPPEAGEARGPTGGGLAAREGIITEVDPVNYTYVLKDNSEAPIYDVIPFGDSGGARGEGDIRIYDVDTRVVIFEMEDGRSFFIPMDSGNADPLAYQIEDAGNITNVGTSTPSSAEDNDVSHRGTRPYDLQEGDRVIRGFMGNMVAVLTNGVTMLRGSKTAEIIANALDGAVQIVSNKFRHIIPSWGHIYIEEQPDGGASLVIRANPSKNSTGEGEHLIAIDIGSTGGLIRASVRDGSGQEVGFIHIGSDGGISMSSAPSLISHESREYKRTVTGEAVMRHDGPVTVIHGDKRTVLGDSDEERWSGAKKVSTNSLSMSGITRVEMTAGMLSQAASGNALSVPTPQSVSHDVSVSGGSQKITIGTGLDAAAFPSFACDVKGGNASFMVGSQTTGRFQVISKAAMGPIGVPPTVEGTPADPNANALAALPGIFLMSQGSKLPVPPVRWDAQDWLLFMTNLCIYNLTHTHQLAAGPLIPGPPVPTLPPIASPSALAVTQPFVGEPAKIYTSQTTGVAVMVS